MQNAKSQPSGLTNSHTLDMSSSKAPSQWNHKKLMPSRIGQCQHPKKSCRLFLDWLIITPNLLGTLRHSWHPALTFVQKCSVAVDSRTWRIHYSLKKCTRVCASVANARFQQSILDWVRCQLVGCGRCTNPAWCWRQSTTRVLHVQITHASTTQLSDSRQGTLCHSCIMWMVETVYTRATNNCPQRSRATETLHGATYPQQEVSQMAREIGRHANNHSI